MDDVWRAEITDAGRFYLRHGHQLDRPEPGVAAAALEYDASKKHAANYFSR